MGFPGIKVGDQRDTDYDPFRAYEGQKVGQVLMGEGRHCACVGSVDLGIHILNIYNKAVYALSG